MKRVLAIGTLIVALAATFDAVNAAETGPAQTLHDTYCIACHDTRVYTRQSRLARDFDGVRVQVNQWQSTISLGWSDEEIDLMARWLASRFYKLPCPKLC